MKMRQPHLVPLSVQAVAILRELRPLTGAGGISSQACAIGACRFRT